MKRTFPLHALGLFSTRRLTKAGAWLIYFCLILELFTRLYLFIRDEDIQAYRNFSFTRVPSLVEDPYTQYRLRPNFKESLLASDFMITYETNDLGLRDKNISNAKAQYRILFLGNSFTFGIGVPTDKRFSDLIEDAFPNVQTINAGVPGYGIHQMVSWYEHYASHMQADLVLVPVLECNIDRAIKAHMGQKDKCILSQGRPPEHSEPNGPSRSLFKGCIYVFDKFKHRLTPHLQRSYFYSYFSVKWQIFRMTRILQKRDEDAWRSINDGKDLGEDRYFKQKYREIVVGKIFHSLHETTSQCRAKVAIINIDVYPKPWLADLLSESNIPYIDISPHLMNATNIRFKLDPHYNSHGNELIANALAEKLIAFIPNYLHPIQPKTVISKQG